MKHKKLRSHCPINYGLEAFGDKWTLLILRDIIFRGKKTYGEFIKSEEKIATNVLATRLSFLVDIDILKKKTHPEDDRKDLYLLTEKGLDLIPVIFEIVLWSSKYDKKSEARLIPKLVNKIRKDNREITAIAKEIVSSGDHLIPHFIEK